MATKVSLARRKRGLTMGGGSFGLGPGGFVTGPSFAGNPYTRGPLLGARKKAMESLIGGRTGGKRSDLMKKHMAARQARSSRAIGGGLGLGKGRRMARRGAY